MPHFSHLHMICHPCTLDCAPPATHGIHKMLMLLLVFAVPVRQVAALKRMLTSATAKKKSPRPDSNTPRERDDADRDEKPIKKKKKAAGAGA